MNALRPVFPTHPRPVIANRIARFVVPDMTTRQCTRQIMAGMKRLDGIKSVRTNITTHRIVVRFEPQLTGLGAMTAEIERAGSSTRNASSMIEVWGKRPRGISRQPEGDVHDSGANLVGLTVGPAEGAGHGMDLKIHRPAGALHQIFRPRTQQVDLDAVGRRHIAADRQAHCLGPQHRRHRQGACCRC